MATILIVDDQRSIAHLWGRGFRAMGYEVLIAYGGTEAIRKIKSEGMPDVIVLDQIMSHGHGADVIHAMADLDPNHQVPIYLVTAEPDIFLKDKAQNRITKILRKPVLFRELSAMIQEVLAKAADQPASESKGNGPATSGS
jgi:DNA-binding NtrC family response regulator